MLTNLFSGIFDTDMTSVISVSDFLLCVICALVIGLMLAGAYMYRSRYTKSFVATLALLPAIVCVVIMMVNGNVGTGVAVAGAFSLVRFRSIPGSAREIGSLFLAMGTGLVVGMGYIAYAFLFAIILGGINMLFPISASAPANIQTDSAPSTLPCRKIWITPTYSRTYLKNIQKNTSSSR